MNRRAREKPGFSFTSAFSTEQEATSLEYATIFKETLELHEILPSQIQGGILSSVVPSVTGTVKEAAEKYTGARILVVSPGIKTGLKMNVDDPAAQGSDLIVGAVAGVHCHPSLRLSSIWERLRLSL